MKCLEKDRARRYETANGLASDVQRHLSNEPVVACPPSAAYRFQKLVRRNKLMFAAASAVTASLIIGLGVSTWMFLQERAALRRAVVAEHEQARLRQVADASGNQAKADAKNARTAAAKNLQLVQFFDEMLQAVGPEVAKGRDATILKEILDKTAQRIGNGLTNQPQSEAYLRESIAKVYLDLGDYHSAEAMQRRTVALYQQLYPNGHRELAFALDSLAVILGLQGQLPEAESLSREAVAMGKKLFGAEHADIAAWMTDLAMILKHEGRYADAETIYREALAKNRKLLGNEHREVVTSLNNLSIALAEQKKYTEAEGLIREALQMGRHLWGNEHPSTARHLTSLTEMLMRQGKLPEAEATGREAVALEKKVSGPEHADVATALANLAGVLAEQDKLPEAEAMQRGCRPVGETPTGAVETTALPIT